MTQERMRKLMAQDPAMYPQLTAARNPPSIYSVSSSSTSSTTSTGTAVNAIRMTKGGPIVISDSEDDEPQPLQRSNAHPNVATKPTSTTKPVPVHLPSNKDLYNETSKVIEPQEEAFDTRGIDVTYDPLMTTEDSNKALRDLIADAYSHEEQHIDMSEAKVEGFNDNITLLPHQVLARRWMAERETGKKLGGMLADDMGLGKTAQTLVRIVDGPPSKADRKLGYARATLVVCPVAVVSQWASEIRKMTVGLSVIEHHGPSRTSDPNVLAKADVVVSSYNTVASEHGVFDPPAKNEGKKKAGKSQKSSQGLSDDSDSDVGRTIKKAPSKKKDALFHVKWWRIVLDEAHNIKNRNTKAALACCALEGKFRWCLTGTPMQNNVEELYSLLKFLRIRPLNDWQTFKEQIAQPVKQNRPVRAMKRLQVVLRAIMLRRLKTTVLNGKPLLELPDRIVKQVECKFDSGEQAFYDGVEERIRERVDSLEAQGNMQKAYTSILVLLLRLRQACNHPSLVSEDYKKDGDALEPKGAKEGDEGADELADLMGGLGLAASQKRCQFCQVVLSSDNLGIREDNCYECDDLARKSRKSKAELDLPPDSAKTRKVMELLAEIDERCQDHGNKEKTIIFSQFTSMLDLFQPFLKAKGIKFVRYDGSMNKVKRDEALQTIRTSKTTRVILISFKAGSTGLNLTCCNNVILTDMWWNPALEDQAFDRAHRLGQTRNVNIYKLSVPNTVETRILELQEKKRALATAALSGDKINNARLGIEDLMALFRPSANDDDDDD